MTKTSTFIKKIEYFIIIIHYLSTHIKEKASFPAFYNVIPLSSKSFIMEAIYSKSLVRPPPVIPAVNQ